MGSVPLHPVRDGNVLRLDAVQNSKGIRIDAAVDRIPMSEPGQELEFVIFRTPPMTMEDERARPVKPEG